MLCETPTRSVVTWALLLRLQFAAPPGKVGVRLGWRHTMLTVVVSVAVLASPPRVVMASPYDRELDLVVIRATEQRSADRIVFCESTRTQAGHPRAVRLPVIKRLYPHIETYSASCDAAHRDYKLGWGCENTPRACAVRWACASEPDSTVVVISDTDEIVAAEVIASLRTAAPPLGIEIALSSRMSVHMYGFFWERPNTQYSTAHAKTCGTIRGYPHPKRIQYPRFSGWHCSYCFPVDEYLSKMHSMLKGDGWLALSDHYWPMEALWAFRQYGVPLNGKERMQPARTRPPKAAAMFPYLVRNTNLTIQLPAHPFTWPRT